MFGKNNQKIFRIITGIIAVLLMVGMVLLYTPIGSF
jgi:predicted nucleic acid-binding Zn ribbon protein